jgi:CHAD domain-containing protein
MSRSVELSLEIEPPFAGEWPRGRAARSHAAKERADSKRADGRSADPEIADALERIPGVVMTSPREAVTIRVSEHRSHRARTVAEESPDGWCVLTSHAACVAPGVALRNTVCNERLAPGKPLAASDALPPEFGAKTGEGDRVASAPLAMQRTAYLWHAADGRPVTIVLLCSADDIVPAQQGSGPQGEPKGAPFLSTFSELRLACACDEGTRASESLDTVSASDSYADPDYPSDPAAQAATSALFEAARLLIDRLPAFPVLTDVYARIAGDTLGVQPVRAARVDLAGARNPHEAMIAIAANIARQWFGNERGVRQSTDVEFVHQMRVALRRGKTLLKTFPDWADEAWRTRLKPGFGWLGEMLGQARDFDVFVDSTLPDLAAADADPSAWSGLITATDARRIKARARLQQALRSSHYAQLTLGWIEWLAGQRFSQGPPRYAGRALQRYVAKRVRKHFERLTAEPPLTALDAASRHRRRIAAKRLRYTLEFFEPVLAPGRHRKIARRLSRIQTVLGEGNDAAAALQFFERERFDVTPHQRGFARGWSAAINRSAAQEGERLIRKLRKPKIAHYK